MLRWTSCPVTPPDSTLYTCELAGTQLGLCEDIAFALSAPAPTRSVRCPACGARTSTRTSAASNGSGCSTSICPCRATAVLSPTGPPSPSRSPARWRPPGDWPTTPRCAATPISDLRGRRSMACAVLGLRRTDDHHHHAACGTRRKTRDHCGQRAGLADVRCDRERRPRARSPTAGSGSGTTTTRRCGARSWSRWSPTPRDTVTASTSPTGRWASRAGCECSCWPADPTGLAAETECSSPTSRTPPLTTACGWASPRSWIS